MSPGRVGEEAAFAFPVFAWNTAPGRPERSASYDNLRLLHADCLDFQEVQGLSMADALFDKDLGILSPEPARHGSFRSCAQRGSHGSPVKLSTHVSVGQSVERADRREREPNVGPELGGGMRESSWEFSSKSSSQPIRMYVKETNGRAQPVLARRFSTSRLGLDERPAPVRESRSFGGSWSSKPRIKKAWGPTAKTFAQSSNSMSTGDSMSNSNCEDDTSNSFGFPSGQATNSWEKSEWDSSGSIFCLDELSVTTLSRGSLRSFCEEEKRSSRLSTLRVLLGRHLASSATLSESDCVDSASSGDSSQFGNNGSNAASIASTENASTPLSDKAPKRGSPRQVASGGTWGNSMPNLFKAKGPCDDNSAAFQLQPSLVSTPPSPFGSRRNVSLLKQASSGRLSKRSLLMDTVDLGQFDRISSDIKSLPAVDSVPSDLPRAHTVFEVMPLPERDEAAFSRGAALLNTLDLNPFDFCPEDLIHLVLEIFDRLELPARLNLDRFRLEAFVMCVRHSMRDSNSYHSWIHVFDVTHTVYVLARDSGMMDTLHDIDRFALIVAALCHDLDHPGFSNMKLAEAVVSHRAQADRAFNPRDKLLEKHHSLRAFEIMVSLNIDLLHGLSTNDFYSFRRTVESVILATDMSKHAVFVAAASVDVDGAADGEVHSGRTSSSEASQADAKKMLQMQILLKAADISNVIKPFHVAARWAVCVTDEFFNQGQMEREAGLAVSPNCDEATVSRVGLQRGFIDFLARPFYVVVAHMFPELECLLVQIDENRKLWDGYSQEQLLDEYAVSARRWHKVASADEDQLRTPNLSRAASRVSSLLGSESFSSSSGLFDGIMAFCGSPEMSSNDLLNIYAAGRLNLESIVQPR